MVITSVSNKKIIEYEKLKQTKYRKQNKLFIVEGEHLVEEAYKNNKIKEVFVLDGYNLKIDVPCTVVTESVMKKLSSLDTITNVLAICTYSSNNMIKGNHILMLDCIQDPGNLGTIIRSSLAFNIDTIILSNDSVDLYNSKVIRSTQGMIFGMNIIYQDLENTILDLKEKNYIIYGTDVNKGIDVKTLNDTNKEKYVLVMGNEGQGLSNNIKELCDKFLYIKMNSKVESLNVGVATSILIYELNNR
ncbi:MAG: RNA methyltransferase [Bacilli bacterium]|nr:RNA methyltransferase [Bacilli bacterium]